MKNLTLIEAFNRVVSQNITSTWDLDEFKAVKFQDRAYNDNFPKVARVTVNTTNNSTIDEADMLVKAGFVVNANRAPVTVETEYGEFEINARAIMHNSYDGCVQRFSTDVAVGGAIKRKQAKYPNGMYLTNAMLLESASYQEFKAVNSNNVKLLNQMEIARFLVALSETEYVQADLLEAVLLEKEYRKLTSKDAQIEFLEMNGFTGLENFNYESTSSADGWGHQNVSCMALNFEDKVCYVAYGNSGD